MISRFHSAIDGIVTAVAITLLARYLGRQSGIAAEVVGAWLFHLNAVLLLGSIPVTAFGRRSPPGVIDAMRGRPGTPPPAIEGRDSWFDRFASFDNARLVAAFALFVISLAPPFPGLD